MSQRPRVLFLSQRFLFPMDTGGKIRTGKLLEQLRQRWALTIVGNYEQAKDGPHYEEMEALCDRYVPVDWSERKRGSVGWYLSTLKKSLSKLPVSVANDTSADLTAAIQKELRSGQYDLYICDFLQSTLNAPPPHKLPSLLFTHNVEARIARRHAETAGSKALQKFWKRQARLLEEYEGKTAEGFDRVVAVSDSDRKEFLRKYRLVNVRTIPTGVDTEYFRPGGAEHVPGSIVFCGSMDWLPNQDGVRWFVQDILPRVRKEAPHAHLTVVGRRPPDKFVKEMSADAPVNFTGWVDDTRPYVDRSSCYVVPLRVGGGTRIKIYEALAMEKPLVSTKVGAEGLPLTHEEHLLLADEPEAFAKAVAQCLKDEDAARSLGDRARIHVCENYSWERVADAFDKIAQEAIEVGRRRLGPGVAAAQKAAQQAAAKSGADGT